MGGLIPAWKCSACLTAGPRPPPAPAGLWVERRKQRLSREKSLPWCTRRVQPSSPVPFSQLGAQNALNAQRDDSRETGSAGFGRSRCLLPCWRLWKLLTSSLHQLFPSYLSKNPPESSPHPACQCPSSMVPQAMGMAVMASESHPRGLYW